MDYAELCHSSKKNDITRFIIKDLEWKIEHGFATKLDKKAYKIFDSDFGSVIAYSGVWYIDKNSYLTKLPNYFYTWLESYCKKQYNILPLFDHGSRYN